MAARREQNKNAEKYGFSASISLMKPGRFFSAIEQSDPLDLLWHQIQIAYAAIIRAQRIAYVKDQKDKTIEKSRGERRNVCGEKWEVQQAWDKQNEFLKAQARAQSELRSMIKQYDEMLHKNWRWRARNRGRGLMPLKIQAANAAGQGMRK